MKIFDACIRSDTRSETDLKNLHYFETERVVTTAHAPRRFERSDDLLGYFEMLVTDEATRLRRCGLVPHVAVGVLPSAQPRRTHREVWREMPFVLELPEVVAIGEIGAWEDSAAHWELFERQLRIGLDHGPMAVVVTPPRELRVNMTYKMMQHVEKVGYPPELVLFNYCDERLVETVVQEGFVAGIPVGAYSIEPREAARMLAEVMENLQSPERLVLNSALRAGGSDILGIPKTVVALQDLGVDTTTIERLAYGNAMRLFIRQ